MSKVNKVFGVLDTIWDALIIAGIVCLLLLRFAPIPFGYTPVVCLSNSMAPTFYEGDLIYIDKNYNVEEAKIGDIIAFELNDGSQVTHRINDMTDMGIITKGDANEDVDIAPVSNEQVIGENVLQLSGIGEFFRIDITTLFGNGVLGFLQGFFSMFLVQVMIFVLAVKAFLSYMAGTGKEEGEEDEEGEENNPNNGNTSDTN